MKHSALIIWFTLLSATVYAQPCEPVVNLGDTVSFCQGNSLTLNASNPNSTYWWSTGASSPTISVSSTGTYWVRVTNSCGSTSDTVEVIVDSPLSVNLGPDRPLCNGGTTLNAPFSPSNNYVWSTGDTTASITASNPGTYWVAVTNACGTFRDTVQFSSAVSGNFSLGPDIVACDSNSVTLSVPTSVNGQFQWSNGQGGRSIQVFNSGTYWVRMTNPCGVFRDTIQVTLGRNRQLNFPDTVRFCPGGSDTITGNLSGSYSWSPGGSGRSLVINQAGTYTVTFTDVCGTLHDTIVAVEKTAPQVDLGKDTAICSPLWLQSGVVANSYLWNDGSTNANLQVDTSGTYWVEVSNECGTRRDTIVVSRYEGPSQKMLDTVGYCVDTPAVVDAGAWQPWTNYEWNNGDTTRISQFQSTGEKWVRIETFCGYDTIRFYARPDGLLPQLNFKDTSFCDSILYYINLPQLSMTDSARWSTGSGDDSIAIPRSGTFGATIFNTCDTVSDSADFVVYPMPGGIQFMSPILCAGGSLTLSAQPQDSVNYLWSDGSRSSSIQVSSPGIYWLRLANRCDTVVDSITVVEDTPIDLGLPEDTVVCRPNNLQVNLPYFRGRKFFVNGSRLPNPMHIITTSGQYIFRGENACGSTTDTLNVSFIDPPVSRLNDREFCTGGTITLDATQSQADSYLWNTGDTTGSIQVSQGGWYTVAISNDCKTLIDSAYVDEQQPIPPIDLGNDTIFCEGTLVLDPGNFPGADYRWQNGATGSIFIVSRSGQYSVEVSNSCNTRRDTIIVLITGPPQLVLGTEVHYCAQNTFQLNAQNPGSDYLWNTGDTTATITATTPGTYWVRITNDCGQLTDSVEVIQDFPLDDLKLGKDTIICRGESLLLDPLTRGADVTWNDGSRDSTLRVSFTGTYGMEAENACGVFRDSIYVLVQDVPVFSIDDTVICSLPGSTVQVAGPRGMIEYQWSNGDRFPQTTISEHGTYSLLVRNRCFSYTDTFEVVAEDPIEFDLPEDTVICESDSVLLDLSYLNKPVRWADGTIGNSRHVKTPGVYEALVRNACGFYRHLIELKVEPNLQDSSYQRILCTDDSLVLGFENENYNYIWQDSSRQGQLVIRSEGSYELVVENLCGISQHSYEVEEIPCDCPVHMAKAFTPNGDGINDLYRPQSACEFEQFEWMIIDRWGKIIFEGNALDQSWGGMVHGSLASPGVYVYKLRYRWNVEGREYSRQEHGHFTLIR